MTKTITELQAEWTKLHYLALHIVREELRFEDGSVPPDDVVDDAIAHAWQRFVRVSAKRPEVAAKSRIRWAAKHGVSRARARQRFVPTRPHARYVDAMDRRGGARVEYREDVVEQPVAGGYRDPSDRTYVETLIGKLPTLELQAIARLFSYGCPKDIVAERREISRSTLYVRIEELRKLIPGTLPEATETGETETAAVRFGAPSLSPAYAALLTAIGIEHEPSLTAIACEYPMTFPGR